MDTKVEQDGTKRGVEPQIRRRLALGSALSALLLFGLGGWGAIASISSAVIAPGIVVVDGSDKKVQHPTGGVVGAILVKNGDRVTAGDVLVRLDATQARASLGIIAAEQTQLQGRKARLEAERDQATALKFAKGFEDSAAEAAEIAAAERRLYAARIAGKEGQKKQLRERIGQLHREIEGLTSQLAAKKSEVALAADEHARVAEMRDKNLVPVTRALSAERDVTRLKGEEGLLVSSIARAEGQISEIEVQILSLDQNMQSDSMKELREVDARLSELAERRTAAQDQLDRVEIRSPKTGRVNDMQIHTVGGVIGPGETLMMIVPDEEKLAVEVRIAPTDIDQITPGQKTMLRFSAFNQRTTPEFSGEISQIAANLTREQQTGASYYLARIALTGEHEEKMRQLRLVPGMPVETFIETGERKAMSFLMKPFTDQMARAFKED